MVRIKSIPKRLGHFRGVGDFVQRVTKRARGRKAYKLGRKYNFNTFPGHSSNMRLFGGYGGFKKYMSRMYSAPARGFIQRRRFRNDRPMMRKRKLNRSGYSGRRGFGR